MLQGFCSMACQIATITYTHTRTHTRVHGWGLMGSMCAPVHTCLCTAFMHEPGSSREGCPRSPEQGTLDAQWPSIPGRSASSQPRHRVEASKGLPGPLSLSPPCSSLCAFTASFPCLWSLLPSLFLQVELVELCSSLKAQCCCYLFQDAISDSNIVPLIAR